MFRHKIRLLLLLLLCAVTLPLLGNRHGHCLPCPEEPIIEPEPTGACSTDGAACASDADCAPATLFGVCITRNDGHDTACVYDTRWDTGAEVVCEGLAYGHCETGLDCPTGMSCGTFGDSWCDVEAMGVCAFPVGGWIGHPESDCATDADCTLDPPNVCVICGDGVVQANQGACNYDQCVQEQCDDGNVAAGDGCSPDCRFEGRCVDAHGYPLHELGCATAADCLREPFGWDCEAEGPCTCVIP